jgi:parvulin-like peptidyl-prolyl isomerase
MEEIKARLKAGEDFADLARKHSIGPHKDEGGDWGFLKRTDLIEGLREALPGMKVGEVKGPVQTKKYMHLLKVTEMKQPAVKPLKDVQDMIKVMLRKQAYLVETQKYVDELRRKAHVKILDAR